MVTVGENDKLETLGSIHNAPCNDPIALLNLSLSTEEKANISMKKHNNSVIISANVVIHNGDPGSHSSLLHFFLLSFAITQSCLRELGAKNVINFPRIILGLSPDWIANIPSIINSRSKTSFSDLVFNFPAMGRKIKFAPTAP